MTTFPHWVNAPSALLGLDGHCGPLAVWGVLRHLRVRTSAPSLIRALRHSTKGVFTISIAVVLAEYGLEVAFHSDTDPDIQPLEHQLYAKARRLGVSIEPAASVQYLASAVRNERVPVVFYRLLNGEGHFSPMLGVCDKHVVLPYGNPERLTVETFRRAWRRPGFPRQVVIASRPAKRRLEPSALIRRGTRHATRRRGSIAGR